MKKNKLLETTGLVPGGRRPDARVSVRGIVPSGLLGMDENLAAVGEIRKIRDLRPVFLVAHLLALAALGVAFRPLYTLGTRYGFEKGVEYWLFRPDDSAPLVIIGLCLWLGYRRSNRLRALSLETGPLWLILACIALAIAFFLWATYTSALDLQVISLGLALAGLAVAYGGLQALRILWLPLVLLLFAIPLPAPLMLAIIFKLQMWSAQSAGFFLYLLGIPHLVSGDQIFRVTQAFQVIEGCSGMRSIQILTLLSVLLADLFQRRGWHAAILILIAPFIAFGLNGLRVLTLILNPHSEMIAIHNLQGIAILLVGLLIIYGIDSQLERFPRLQSPVLIPRPPSRRFSSGFAFSSLLVLALATHAAALWLPVWQPSPIQQHSPHVLVGGALEQWSSEKIPPDFSWRGSTRFSEVLMREYHLETKPVSVFVATSDLGQRGGSPLSPITALPGSGWRVLRDEWVEREPDHVVQTRLVEKGKQRLLVHHWVIGSKGLLIETLRTFFALDRSTLSRPGPIVVVRLSTPVQDRRGSSLEAARERLLLIERTIEPTLELLSASTARMMIQG